MTEPTMSSMTTYGSMDVSSVRVHGPITQDNHATTKLYVDQSAAAVRDGIVNGAGPALDTLKEIEQYLNGEPNVSGGLISQISSVQSQLDSEVMRAMGAGPYSAISNQREIIASRKQQILMLGSFTRSQQERTMTRVQMLKPGTWRSG